MLYLIKRTDQGGGYLRPPGGRYVYTKNIELAWRFTTREEAQNRCCPDNEVVVELGPNEP